MDKEELKLKKNFVNYCHDLKIKMVKANMTKQVSIISLKELIRNEKVDVKELKSLWNNGKKMLN